MRYTRQQCRNAPAREICGASSIRAPDSSPSPPRRIAMRVARWDININVRSTRKRRATWIFLAKRPTPFLGSSLFHFSAHTLSLKRAPPTRSMNPRILCLSDLWGLVATTLWKVNSARPVTSKRPCRSYGFK